MEWHDAEVSGGRATFFVRMAGAEPWSPVADAAAERDDLILLLHGWPQDGSAWRLVAPALVEAGYRVACPDLKGYGRSSLPTRGYDPETLADEISQLIRNLHARKAVLVGHDWGGAVALATAFRHPGRVRALVVASAPYRQLDLRAGWHIPLLNLPVAPELAFRVAPGLLVRVAILHAAKVSDHLDDDALAAYSAAVAARPRAWLAYYRNLSRRAVVDWTVRQVQRRVPFLPGPREPNRLRVPAVVVWGEDDRATPHRLATNVASDLDAELVTIPGVGHFVHEEAPDAVAEAILDLAGRTVADEGSGGGKRTG